MTTQTEALKLALEALENLIPIGKRTANLQTKSITAIKEALAQQEGQSNYCLQCEALSRELAALKTQQSNEQSKCNHTKTITRADIDGNQIETTCGECGERVVQQWLDVVRGLLSNEQVEPVAWQERQAKRMSDGVVTEWTNWYPCRYRTIDEARAEACDHIPYEWRPLYTTPPQRKPLTDEGIDAAIKCAKKVDTGYAGWVRDQRREFARAIEAAHGIYAPSERRPTDFKE